MTKDQQGDLESNLGRHREPAGGWSGRFMAEGGGSDGCLAQHPQGSEPLPDGFPVGRNSYRQSLNMMSYRHGDGPSAAVASSVHPRHGR